MRRKVVDDSRIIRVLVRHALEPSGFEIVEAVDGQDGIVKMSEHVDASVVLCDVNMPVLGGIEMVETARRDGRAEGRFFLMLTAEANAAVVRRAKQCGADGWIVKPFQPEALLGAVRQLVGGAAG
jgi:two-component system chemotaxis response regulator CheY